MNLNLCLAMLHAKCVNSALDTIMFFLSHPLLPAIMQLYVTMMMMMTMEFVILGKNLTLFRGIVIHW